jgi:predicted permease
MGWWQELVDRVRASRAREADEREMAEEMAFHLAETESQLMREGHSAASARRQARIQFGSVDRFQEEARTESRARWLEQFVEDVRFGMRTFTRQKSWALSIVVVLALGVGANTAVFSLVDAVLFRAPDAVRPGELVRIYGESEEDEVATSYPLFRDYRERARTLSDVAATSTGAALNVVVGNQPAERLYGTIVTGNYFELLGTRPQIGRLLSPEDDRVKNAHAVVVLSYEYWQRVFAGDRAVIGQTLRLNGTPFTVIGVTPRGFKGESFDHDTQLWLSTAMTEVAQPDWIELAPLERRGISWLDLVARLAPGATAQQAQAELSSLARAVTPAEIGQTGVRVLPASAATITVDRMSAASRLSWILLGVVALVLLLACADVAALLLARAEQRRRELAVRLALGATRGRLIRQLLVECMMLAVAGAAAGLAIARLLRLGVSRMAPVDFLIPIGSAARMTDARVLGLAALTAVLSALVFGVAPALSATRFALPGVLRGQGAALRVFGPLRLTLRDTLVVLQLALCLVFLTGAALLGRSLRNVAELDLGFTRSGVVMGRIDLKRNGYNRERSEVFNGQLLERLRAEPGVQAAALAFHPTIRNSGLRTSTEFEGHVYPNPEATPSTDVNIVTPGYLRTVGTQLLAGRDFTAADIESSARVAIVSKALADRYWPGQNPIGKHIGAISTPPVQVVGVVANAKYRTLREEPHPLVLVPLSQIHITPITAVVRSDMDAAAVQRLITRVVAELDPNIPVFASGTVEQQLADALAQERLVAILLSAFSILALVLSAAGLFALVSFIVRTRTREWGIRIAIGARPADVTRHVQARGARIAIAGIGLGLVGAFALTRYLQTLLFGVQPTDPLSFALAALLLFGIALLAGYLPARAATRMDAVTALRTE